jgi:hypothetical protein
MSTPSIPAANAYHDAPMPGGGRQPTLVVVALAAVALAATASCRQVLGITDPPPMCTDPLMIDDMEDGLGDICDTSGRHGTWFTVGDGTSTNLTPADGSAFHPDLIPGGRDASRYAAHLTGSGFEWWGALMGFNLKIEGTARRAYDAGTTSGVTFWMKSNVPVAVELLIPGTIAPLHGGACVDTETKTNCNNHYGFYFSRPSPDWTEYFLPYSALTQPDGTPAVALSRPADAPVWSPSNLVAVQFVAPAGESFDIWVDDIRFDHSCTTPNCVPTCTDPELPVACPATDALAAGCSPAGTICKDRLTADMPGAWGSAPDDVWAFGSGGTIVHWNGSTWSRVPSGTDEWLSVAWGSARDDVWAVGFGGTILHWNGGAWSPVASGTTYTLTRVWGKEPNDIWAVGHDGAARGTIVHWNGSEWTTVSTAAFPPLVGVWGSDREHVWAAGAAGTILRYDGVAWSAETRATSADLYCVWGNGPNDVWTVGFGGTTAHWDGSAWSVVPTGQAADFIGVWASGPADAWAVGRYGAVAHWDGVAWSRIIVNAGAP